MLREIDLILNKMVQASFMGPKHWYFYSVKFAHCKQSKHLNFL